MSNSDGKELNRNGTTVPDSVLFDPVELPQRPVTPASPFTSSPIPAPDAGEARFVIVGTQWTNQAVANFLIEVSEDGVNYPEKSKILDCTKAAMKQNLNGDLICFIGKDFRTANPNRVIRVTAEVTTGVIQFVASVQYGPFGLGQ